MTPTIVSEADASRIWRGVLIHWNDRVTWHDRLTDWLCFRLAPGALDSLRSMGERDLCWDDSDWLDELEPFLTTDIDETVEDLGSDLDGAVARVYHGTRVSDAGVFHREGLKLHDPETLMDEARRIVSEEEELAWLAPGLEARLAETRAQYGSDQGRLFVCVDDRPQLDHIGHYCLYGSEWISGALGPGARRVLLRRGVPTMVELNLPLSWVSLRTRSSYASHLLQEWTRVTVNQPDWTPKLDFSFMMQVALPAEQVIAHTHPAALPDLFDEYRLRRSETTRCPSCAPAPVVK